MNMTSLQKNMLFKDITEIEISKCLEVLDAREKKFRKGAAIMQAGSVTRCMGVVLSGSVTIESNDIWGNCTILSNVSEGGIFAETYALLKDEVMLVDVRANENCNILFLDIGELLSPGQSAPWKEKLTRNLLMISAHKNLTLSGRSFHTSPKSARGRILSYLNTVSLQKHSAKFDIPFDRQQMADYLNLERTNMSKELSRMQSEGLIKFRKNHFELLE